MKYARIENGIVAEPLRTPPEGFSIEDCFHPGLTWIDVTALSPLPEPGWLFDGTAFSEPPPPPTPTLAQQAAAMLAAGCQIVSTVTPALGGTYGLDQVALTGIQAEIMSILLNGTFTNGTGSIDWHDVAGAARTFNVVQFKHFATAIGAFVGALRPIVITDAGALPALPVEID